MSITKTAVKIKRLPHAEHFPLPSYATVGSAGLDLMAAVSSEVIIEPGKRVLIPTGVSIELSVGYEAQIRSRSGFALKNGVFVLNSPGTIDSDYRGEICVILMNVGEESFCIIPGMRIAQMIVASYTFVEWSEVNDLEDTDRSAIGFGSTGA